jgi:hypothetical protein
MLAEKVRRAVISVRVNIDAGPLTLGGGNSPFSGESPLERFFRRFGLGSEVACHACFAARLGGVSGGKENQGWRDSSHTAMVGAGKFGSAKLPIATARRWHSRQWHMEMRDGSPSMVR